MVQSKQKGNTFERKIAKTFSKRFQDYTGLESSFFRNVDSGSYFGGSNKKRIETHGTENANFGDIVTPNNFNFSLECKHYKNAPSFSAMVDQKCKFMDEWIQQAEQDSNNSGKKLAIIMKFNNVKETVILKELFGSLKNIMNYKEYFIVTLDDFLLQENDFFFLDSTNTS